MYNYPRTILVLFGGTEERNGRRQLGLQACALNRNHPNTMARLFSALFLPTSEAVTVRQAVTETALLDSSCGDVPEWRRNEARVLQSTALPLRCSCALCV